MTSNEAEHVEGSAGQDVTAATTAPQEETQQPSSPAPARPRTEEENLRYRAVNSLLGSLRI